MARRAVVMTVAVLIAAGCASEGDSDAASTDEVALALGPVDGHELTGTDLDRVQVGALAPDFTLASLSGAPVTLSDYRGAKDVILVFYRGHW